MAMHFAKRLRLLRDRAAICRFELRAAAISLADASSRALMMVDAARDGAYLIATPAPLGAHYTSRHRASR